MFGRKQKRIQSLEQRCWRLESSYDALAKEYGKTNLRLQVYQRAVAVAAHDLYGFGDVRVQRILDKAAQILNYEEHLCAGDDTGKSAIAMVDDMTDMLEDRELNLTFKQL